MKKVTVFLVGLLLVWFTLDVTGFHFGNFNLVVSAFKDEPIDIVWWVIFIVCFVLFILKDKIGKYVLFVFLVIWGIIQYPMYFKGQKGIERYNHFFANEKTNRIFAASNDFLVKDTYHLFLDVLILLALISTILFIITALRKRIKTHK